MAAHDSHPLIGKVLGGKYEIEARIGGGSMGDVFRARQRPIGRVVALKTLNPALARHPLMTDRMLKEAIAANQVEHEHIVEVTDYGNDGGYSYIVMELLKGQTLGDAIANGQPMPAVRAATILRQIADAMAAAHAKAIVHRDLKPENVFLIRRAKTDDYVKVVDFGIARLRIADLANTLRGGEMMGTPLYMPPELARLGLPRNLGGSDRAPTVEPSMDIYALGVIAFQLVTGRLPFPYTTQSDVYNAHVNEVPPRADHIAAVPARFADVIAEALAKDKQLRPTMTELGERVVEASTQPAVRVAVPAAAPHRAAGADAISHAAGIAVTEPPDGAVPRPEPRSISGSIEPGQRRATASQPTVFAGAEIERVIVAYLDEASNQLAAVAGTIDPTRKLHERTVTWVREQATKHGPDQTRDRRAASVLVEAWAAISGVASTLAFGIELPAQLHGDTALARHVLEVLREWLSELDGDTVDKLRAQLVAYGFIER